MRLLPILLIAPLLVACQSCKKPDPPKPPAPPAPLTDASTQEDASVSLSDAGSSKDAALEAKAPDPWGPCMESLGGAAHAFCEGPSDVLLSTSATAPTTKSKLTVVRSEATMRTRLAIRHVNGSKSAKLKAVVILTNNGAAAGSFTLLRKGVSGPSTNATELERLAAERWATSTAKPSIQVVAGKFVRVDPSVEVGLQEGYATMGLYEYSFSQPHTVTVCFLGEREDASVCAGL